MSMDFPAAHSMDTRWFAVDDDGCVAVFHSGETGPVPRGWKGGQDGGYQLIDRLMAMGAPLNLSPLVAVPPGEEILHFSDNRPAAGIDLHYDLLLRLSHPRVRDALPEVLPVVGPFVRLAHLARTEELQPLLRRGLVERVWCGFDLATPLGMHSFAYNWSQPYTREGTPAHELKLTDLPEAFGAMAVELPDLLFREHQVLSLEDRVDCYSWGS